MAGIVARISYLMSRQTVDGCVGCVDPPCGRAGRADVHFVFFLFFCFFSDLEGLFLLQHFLDFLNKQLLCYE